MKPIMTAALALAVVAGPAAAEPFTLFIYESPTQLALRPAATEAAAAYWSAYDVFGKDLAEAGILRGGSAISTGGPVSHVSIGAVETAQTPYARSELELGGYFQIDVPTEADAIEWAGKLPVLDGGLVEVRAGYPVPMMNAMNGGI